MSDTFMTALSGLMQGSQVVGQRIKEADAKAEEQKRYETDLGFRQSEELRAKSRETRAQEDHDEKMKLALGDDEVSAVIELRKYEREVKRLEAQQNRMTLGNTELYKLQQEANKTTLQGIIDKSKPAAHQLWKSLHGDQPVDPAFERAFADFTLSGMIIKGRSATGNSSFASSASKAHHQSTKEAFSQWKDLNSESARQDAILEDIVANKQTGEVPDNELHAHLLETDSAYKDAYAKSVEYKTTANNLYNFWKSGDKAGTYNTMATAVSLQDKWDAEKVNEDDVSKSLGMNPVIKQETPDLIEDPVIEPTPATEPVAEPVAERKEGSEKPVKRPWGGGSSGFIGQVYKSLDTDLKKAIREVAGDPPSGRGGANHPSRVMYRDLKPKIDEYVKQAREVLGSRPTQTEITIWARGIAQEMIASSGNILDVEVLGKKNVSHKVNGVN